MKVQPKPSISSKRDRANRKAFPPRREPYWARVERGCHVGYRQLVEGDGNWIARWRDDEGKQHYRALGQYDQYDDAVREANKWFMQNGQGARPAASTIEEVCRTYVSHLKTSNSASSSNDAEGRFKRLVYGTKFSKLALDKVRTTDIQRWRDAQVADADDESADDVRRSKDSANRNLSSLKAALNYALKSRLVATDAGWKTVTAFRDVGRRRERFLLLDERNALLDACPADFRRFVTALLHTGARPGEIAAARVKDFSKVHKTLTLEGKTGRRVATLSTDAAAIFKDCCKDKLPEAFIFTRETGEQWGKDYWKEVFRKAVKDAGLPADVVLYSIRHAAISEMIAGGMDSLVVAMLTGTSVQMIEKHYGKMRHDKTRQMLDAVRMM